jgi:tripartite-type tricarboxylate transporter receptor subunit TctC
MRVGKPQRSFVRPMVLAAAALAATLIAAGIVRADYPERPITIIVGFPPGGGSDVVARMLGVTLGERLGKPVVIENKPGAGGNIGIGVAAHARPDGYTLLLCSSVYVVNPSLYDQVPYDPLRDFIPLLNIGAAPNVYVVRADSDMKTWSDLIAKARANPGKMNFTTAGIGTTAHLSAEVLKSRTGIEIVNIPFAGSGPAAQAVLAGTVDFMVASVPSVAGQLAAGQFRALAQAGSKPWPDLAEVPMFGQLGIDDADFDTFQAMFAPAGTPPAVVDRLVKELSAILQQPDMRDRLRVAGLDTLAEGPKVFQARIARELAMFKAIIDRAGIRLK